MKKEKKYLGHHLLVKMSLIKHKMFHEKKNNEIHGTPLVSENVPKKPQNVP